MSRVRSNQVWIRASAVIGALSLALVHLLFLRARNEPIATAFYLMVSDLPLKAGLILGLLLVVALILGLARGQQASASGSAYLVGLVFVAFLYRFFLLSLGDDNAVIVDALSIVVPAGLVAFAGIYLGQWIPSRK